MPLDAGPLAPVSVDSPAGDNLELDPEFGELERSAQGKPEIQYGSTVEPAVPPDWKQTVAVAQSLLERTHDLRVLVHLAIARLHLHGLGGFADTMATIRAELEARWPEVHPQLDPEDDNDPMQRANVLARLGDPALVLRTLRDLPLVSAPRTGPVSWRDIAVANGVLEPEGDKPKLSEAAVLGAFRDGDPARVASVQDALERLSVDVPALSRAFDAGAGAGQGPDYGPLIKLVGDITRDVTRYQASVAADPEAPAEEGAPASAGGAAPAAGSGRGYASIQSISALAKREEALHALELAAGYFRAQEPSSPLPLLIDRARRLAGMEFMDILRDLAPDGLSQAQLVAGRPGE